MDTSEVYIKMCDCVEVQRNRNLFPFLFDANFSYIDNNVFVGLERKTTNWRTIWLPRQGQVQEMMGKTELAFCIYQIENKWGGEIYQDREQIFTIKMDSPEQLWLAFYMWATHKKTWNNKGWQ